MAMKKSSPWLNLRVDSTLQCTPPLTFDASLSWFDSCFLSSHSSVDPNQFGDPYSRPPSTVSTATSGTDSAWRRRQTIKRGVTRKVKLTNGNFIAEYKVPTPVYSAIEAKYSSTDKTEFSYVIVVDITLVSHIYR